MVLCCVYGCNNRSDKSKKPGVGFHRFPRDEALKRLWIKAVRRENWQPHSTSVVCTEHFPDDDVNRTYITGPRLRENAVPTKFPAYPERFQKAAESFRLSWRRKRGVKSLSNTISINDASCTAGESSLNPTPEPSNKQLLAQSSEPLNPQKTDDNKGISDNNAVSAQGVDLISTVTEVVEDVSSAQEPISIYPLYLLYPLESQKASIPPRTDIKVPEVRVDSDAHTSKETSDSNQQHSPTRELPDEQHSSNPTYLLVACDSDKPPQLQGVDLKVPHNVMSMVSHITPITRMTSQLETTAVSSEKTLSVQFEATQPHWADDSEHIVSSDSTMTS